MKKKEVISSETQLYRKYRLCELMGLIIIFIGGILASISQIYRFRGDTLYNLFLAFIISGIVLIIIGLAIVLIFYYKIKKLKE